MKLFRKLKRSMEEIQKYTRIRMFLTHGFQGLLFTRLPLIEMYFLETMKGPTLFFYNYENCRIFQ